MHLGENRILNLIIAGVFIFLASLTKGAQGMFPLAGVFLYGLLFRKIKVKGIIQFSSILIFVPAGIYCFLLLLNSDVYHSFQNYFNTRYVRAFNNLDSTTGNRFEILFQLVMELLPILLLSLLILIFTRIRSLKTEQELVNYKIMIWLFLIGLSGTLPLIITLEQRNFYLVTALPYFALGIAMLVAPVITRLISNIKTDTYGFKIFRICTVLLLAASLIFTVTRIGKAKRDKDAISDVYSFGKIIPHGEIVGIPPEMINDWSVRYYLLRYYYISLDEQNKSSHYFISMKTLPERCVPANYKRLPIETKLLELYTDGK